MPRQRGGGLGEVSKQQGSGNKSPSQKTRPWAWPSAGLGGNGGREEAGGGGARGVQIRRGLVGLAKGRALSSGSWTPVGVPGELSVSP